VKLLRWEQGSSAYRWRRILGSQLCDALLTQGNEALCVDNLITGSEENLAHLKNEPRFAFKLHDGEPFDCGKVDYVFDLASSASPVDYMEHGIETSNVGSLGTFNSLDLQEV
jgi:dTDP-glucose 4,6-dehydratase